MSAIMNGSECKVTQISNAGAVALAQALHHNSTLEEVDLSGNDGISAEGIRQLVHALTVNTFISEDFHKDGHLVLPERCVRYAIHHHRVRWKISCRCSGQ